MGESSAAKRRAVSDPLTDPIGQIGVMIVAERLFGEALAALLGRQPGIRIAGTCATAVEALAGAGAGKPNVVLLDARLPDLDHLAVIRLVARHSPSSRVLLLTTNHDGGEICRALKAGARGYVSNHAGLPAVIQAIQSVHRGDMWVEPALIAEALWGTGAAAETGDGGLTAREREILTLLATGGTNRHIAEALFISEKTVKTHLHSIFRKLNVTRRLQAVLHASRLGLRQP